MSRSRHKPSGSVDPVRLADPSDLDIGANDACFRLGASEMSFTLTAGFYILWVPVSIPLLRLMAYLSKLKGPATLLLALPLVLNIIIGIVGVMFTTGAVVRERHWPTSLPFALYGYRGLFNRQRDAEHRNSFNAIVWFSSGATPPSSLMAEALFDGVLVSNIVIHGNNAMTLTCGVPMTSMNWLAYRRLRNAVHSIADSVVNLRDGHPVDCVEIVQP